MLLNISSEIRKTNMVDKVCTLTKWRRRKAVIITWTIFLNSYLFDKRLEEQTSCLGEFYFIHSSNKSLSSPTICHGIVQIGIWRYQKDAWHLERHGDTWLHCQLLAFLFLFPWHYIGGGGEGGVMGCVSSLLQIRCLNPLPSLHPSDTGFPGNGIRDATHPPPQELRAGTLTLLISEDNTEGESHEGFGSWVQPKGWKKKRN